jgi:IS5 family transposase
MALGKRKRERQLEAFVSASDLPQSPGHPFYTALNRLLAENDFDSFVEALCAPFYAGVTGRPSIPPGVFFRMTFVGYFEGLPSHRSIAWRCADSRSLAEFLGLGPAEETPDHSSISKTHKRLPKDVFDEVFRFILRVAARKGLLWGEKLGIDSTTIQANASMKSIVRKDSGKGWKDYTKKLAKKAGLDEPTDAELRQFDKKRPGKKVSNDDWENPNDPDARITRMKNGTTRMAYKAEHAVDLESDLIVSATVHPGNAADTATVIDTAIDAAVNLEEAGCESDVKAIVADKGYHSTKVMTLAAEFGMQTYIPERMGPKQRRWAEKDPAEKKAVYAARRRTKSKNGKLLSRTRSELVERSFAHVCDTGGARRTWLRGLQSVTKRHLMKAAARNLSTIMRVICGIGSPRALQGLRALLQLAWTHFDRLISALEHLLGRAIGDGNAAGQSTLAV